MTLKIVVENSIKDNSVVAAEFQPGKLYSLKNNPSSIYLAIPTVRNGSFDLVAVEISNPEHRNFVNYNDKSRFIPVTGTLYVKL